MHSDTNIRLTIPSPQRSIWKNVKKWYFLLYKSRKYFVDCVKEKKIEKKFLNEFNRIYLQNNIYNDSFIDLDIAFSVIISIWLIYCTIKKNKVYLSDSEKWFLGKVNGDELVMNFINNEEIENSGLFNIIIDSNMKDIFPYISEVFQFKSLDISQENIMKKEKGLFFTPADVSDFLANKVINNFASISDEIPTCLDPACGSGILLRSINNMLSKRYELDKFTVLMNNIYGIDINKQAIISCSLSMLFNCIDEIMQKNYSPHKIWLRILNNYVQYNSLLIKKVDQESDDSNLPYLSDLFPNIINNFDIIISNPPYIKYNRGYNQMDLFNNVSNKHIIYNEAYIDFINMMINFTNKKSSSIMIVPLSLSYKINSRFNNLRKSIMNDDSIWEFYFFDRTPDSLFGDRIKVRNCILTRYSNNNNIIKTSNFIRWNIHTRNTLFDNINLVDNNNYDITYGIPKIGHKKMLELYVVLKQQNKKFKDMLRKNDSDNILHYRNTAYNYLPIYKSIPYIQKDGCIIYNESKLNKLYFSSIDDRDLAFSILSSRIAFWLWRIECDGFHLTKSFLYNLPINHNYYTYKEKKMLINLGNLLWSNIEKNPSLKINSGKKSISYYPRNIGNVIDDIDQLLISKFDQDNALSSIKNYIAQTIIVDRDNWDRIPYAKEYL